MAKTASPACDFGQPAPDFRLLGVDGQQWTLNMCRGATGLLVMFICNHCPFVKAIRRQLISDVEALKAIGIGVVAINSNDASSYPEDSYPHMKAVAKQFGYNFPYLADETQAIAKAYGAVCTPDFFGYNASMELQYRGRLDNSPGTATERDPHRELVKAMEQVAISGQGPEQQFPSTGCSIKWRELATQN